MFVCLALVDEMNSATVSEVINGLIFGAVLRFIAVINILQKERVRCLQDAMLMKYTETLCSL